MTILVTGGAGFIGANFVVNWLSDQDEAVVILDKLTYSGATANLAATDREHQTFVQGDIANRTLVAMVLSEHRPRAILNFAAETHVDRSIAGPEVFLTTNVLGTFTLLETARHYLESCGEKAKRFRFLQVSTDEVYGSLPPDAAPCNEMAAFAPNSPYSASKASADHFVRAYFHTYGLPTLITNCTNNYGPMQFPEKLIPVIINNAISGKPIPIYGDGLNIRDWLHVEDHCKAIHTVLTRGVPGETYNIGTGNEVSNITIARTICELLDEMMPDSPYRPHANLIAYVADRPGHDRRYAISSTKVREIGWQPSRSFEAGLRETVRWYLDNQKWTEAALARASH